MCPVKCVEIGMPGTQQLSVCGIRVRELKTQTRLWEPFTQTLPSHAFSLYVTFILETTQITSKYRKQIFLEKIIYFQSQW